MNVRSQQLRERDVRKLSPDLNPSSFLHLYIASNFPQTSALPSPEQISAGITEDQDIDTLKLMKKPLSGTKFDNPGGF
jgi:hypothetical protein